MQYSCTSPPRRKIIFINIVFGLQNHEERYLVLYNGLFVTVSEYFHACYSCVSNKTK
jgi:hypothetical protein